ncbi:hypothetical protein [Aliiroseovarius sp. PrR006]|uniref:hypothetical protein n=1 Tax=Aliiroseovarius sp. PrR006 TaxID=2706883 RepID=UPI0013D29D2E|nr:hypothetical protein [Aliiroseovarius sp. PrR006]NDW53610.1 hypothetical protein [Aliiroseovarius sp. PrR006]
MTLSISLLSIRTGINRQFFCAAASHQQLLRLNRYALAAQRFVGQIQIIGMMILGMNEGLYLEQ